MLGRRHLAVAAPGDRFPNDIIPYRRFFVCRCKRNDRHLFTVNSSEEVSEIFLEFVFLLFIPLKEFKSVDQVSKSNHTWIILIRRSNWMLSAFNKTSFFRALSAIRKYLVADGNQFTRACMPATSDPSVFGGASNRSTPRINNTTFTCL
jgi:hypothetical protein